MSDHADLRVIVVGGGPVLCQRLVDRGAELTLVETRARLDPSVTAMATRTIVTEYDDPALLTMLEALHAFEPFVAAVSLTEAGLQVAADIAAALLLPGLRPDVVERTRDKVLMREWLAERSATPLPFAPVQRRADVEHFVAREGFPVVLKPRAGQGSRGVRLIAGVHDLDALTADLSGFIVESLVPGPEYSVEVMTCSGVHHVAAITAKTTQTADADHPFVEIGHTVPADLPPAAAHAIATFVTSFLDDIGIDEGVSHTEVRLAPDGPQVIETHSRVGGDSIPTLVRHATGFDLIDHFAHFVVHRTCPGREAPLRRAAAVRFLTAEPGRVTAVRGVERAAALPGVLALHVPLAVGDLVEPVRDSSGRLGHVVAVAHDSAAATALCDEVADTVVIETASHDQERTRVVDNSRRQRQQQTSGKD